MKTLILLTLLAIIIVVVRLRKAKKSTKEFVDFTSEFVDNPYFELKDEVDFCDNDGLVSAHRLNVGGYRVLKIKNHILFDPSEPAISVNQFVVIDSRFETIQSKLNKGDLILVKNELDEKVPSYEEYLCKISTVHKNGSITVIRTGRPKRKMERAFIIGKIIKVA